MLHIRSRAFETVCALLLWGVELMKINWDEEVKVKTKEHHVIRSAAVQGLLHAVKADGLVFNRWNLYGSVLQSVGRGR
jgi:hypothetical protein